MFDAFKNNFLYNVKELQTDQLARVCDACEKTTKGERFKIHKRNSNGVSHAMQSRASKV